MKGVIYAADVKSIKVKLENNYLIKLNFVSKVCKIIFGNNFWCSNI